MNISLASLNFLKKQLGYSIVELMIAITLTLFLTAVVFTIFLSSQGITTGLLDSGERQENGAFALQILTRDLKQAYFFAEATGENTEMWNFNGPSLTTSPDCLDNIGSGTFPATGIYRQLWAATVPADMSAEMNCVNDGDSATTLISGTDFISIKRVRGLAQDENFDNDRYYLDINATQLTVYAGDASHLTAVEAGTAPAVWQYIHHVYYLDKKADIPRLRRLRLGKNKMVREEVLVEGVENMQFMFVLDEFLSSERDGAVHAVVATEDVTDNDWNTGRVIGIKIYLLARSLEPTAGYVNDNEYQLGSKTFTAPGDAYKRELVSHVISFPNGMVLGND